MITYVGPISSCISILKILLVYVYKFKDIFKNFNVGVTFVLFRNQNGTIHCTSLTIICSEYYSMKQQPLKMTLTLMLIAKKSLKIPKGW
jgi:hypothetical protein